MRMPAGLQPWTDWRRKRFWLVVAVLAWTLLGFFGAPPLVERGIKQAVTNTGRTIDISDVYTNPYALSLRIRGLEIRDPDESSLVSFDVLYVNFQLSSLFRWAWTFGEIRLSGLHFGEERFESGGTRLGRFVADLAQSPEETKQSPEAGGVPRLVIHSLTLEDGGFEITDNLAGGFHGEFGPVSISATDIRTLPDHSGEKHVSIGTPGGGVIAWRGDLHLVPLASEGHFTITGRGLPAALRYADHFLPISIDGDTVDVSFDYDLWMDEGNLRFIVDKLNSRTGAISARLDGSDQDFLRLAEIELTGGSLRWPEKTAMAQSLTLDGLDLDTWLDGNGRLNLLDALPEPGAGASADAPALDERWAVRLGRLAFNGGTIEFEDRGLATPGQIRAEELALTLSDFTLEEGTEMPADLSVRLASGGSVSYTGSAVILPEFSLDGNATVSGFALPVFQPWLSETLRVELSEGTFDLEAELTGTPPSSMKITGTAGLGGLELSDAVREQRLAALDTLELDRFELDTGAMSIKTSPITLGGAYGRLHIYEDLGTNLDGLVVAGDEPAAEPASNELAVTIDGIEIEDGALDFADDSLPLPFNTSIRSMQGSLSTLSTTSSEPSEVALEGQVDEYGEARIEGSLNPWDFTHSADIDMVFRNLQMSNLSPYTIQYAGYAIERGRLDMDLGYEFNQRRLEGENNIVIRELDLGEKVEHPDAASLPLKLAVALLTDSEGVIDVDLPVSGDLDDPTFKISGIIWKAIGNLITRVVTSPFRFLGGLVGADSEDFGTLRFQAGRADLSPPEQEHLGKLAEALRQRPELSLVVKGVYAPGLDRPALQRQAFEARLDARRSQLLESGEAEAIGADRPALESLFTEEIPDTPLEVVRTEFMRPAPGSEGTDEPPDPVLDEPAYLAALRERLIEAQAIGEEQLEALGAERAIAVFTALESTGSDAPLAVSIADEVESVEGTAGGVVLKLEVDVR